MLIDKNFDDLIDEGHRYCYRANLITNLSLIINLDKPLFVDGVIETEGTLISNCSIETSNYIGVDKDIKVEGSVITDGDIWVGYDFEVTEDIKARNIKVGGSVYARNIIAYTSLDVNWIKAAQDIQVKGITCPYKEMSPEFHILEAHKSRIENRCK